jgi:uncharacterized protein
MQLSGTVVINAPRQKVWDFLTDPNQVASCAPGVEKVEVLGPGKFKATAAIGFGTVKAKFNGDAEFVETDPPNHAKIKAHGSAPGSAADVMSEMTLTDTPEGGTSMAWSANITILGQLASLAARMMAPVSQKLTQQFFESMKKKIEA